jgi:hypothetical protein
MQAIFKIGYCKYLANTEDIPTFIRLQEVEERYLDGESIFLLKDKQVAKEISIVEDSQVRLKDEEVNLTYKELYDQSEKTCDKESSKRWELERELKELKAQLAPKEKVAEND